MNRMNFFLKILIISVTVIVFRGSPDRVAINKSKINSKNDMEFAIEKREFSNDSVIIVLDESYSFFDEVSESSLEALFKGIEYTEIEDLFKIDNPSEELKKFYFTHEFNKIYQIKLADKTKENVLNSIKKLNAIQGIKCAMPNYICKTTGTITTTPSDEYYDDLWGLHGMYGIDAESAWRYTAGVSSVRVGVIDSGICNHLDLGDTIETGYDFYNDNTITNDDISNHGTHVAGIIAASCNNIGVVGVAPFIKLLPLQVDVNQSDEFGVTTSEYIIRAINNSTSLWGTDKHTPILNLSFTGFGYDYGVLAAASNFPGLLVWSSGNNGANVDYAGTGYLGEEFYNGLDFNIDNIVSVGAIGEDGTRIDISNYGNSVDIYAPGDNIMSTGNPNFGLPYIIKRGTSMSAAFVSGVAALLLSYNQNLTAEQLKEALVMGGQYTQISGYSTTYSATRLSAIGSIIYASSNFDRMPGFIRMCLCGKVGNVWKVKLINPNEDSCVVQYKTKTCSMYEASTFSNDNNLNEINIAPLSYSIVDVQQDGNNPFIASSIGRSFSSVNYRRISYTDGLVQSGSNFLTNPVQFNTTTMTNNYQMLNSVPSYLTFKINGKQNGKWKVKICNQNSYSVRVTYNKKMCFESDAKTYSGCHDLEVITISGNSDAEVLISGNFLADYITAKIEYRYGGFSFRKITYANRLSTSSLYASEHTLLNRVV